jgi:hypothetical protein
MKNNSVNEKNKLAEGPIVMADECGDSLWDAVLAQEVKACEIAKAIQKPGTLINKIEHSIENNNR